ncbi:MAG: DUF1800 family protein [Chloracidobacterium sp.]|nr:DUF1800 family protein [Chloracidobacterium sp.]
MKSRISLDFARISAMSLLIILTGTFVFGQKASTRDENYDSPTPVLLSDINTKRAVAQTGRISRKFDPSKIVAQAYQPDARITLYVGDLALMAGEGANALRVYAEDKRGYMYRFPVLDLQRVDGAANVHAMTVLLKDEVGYYEPPTADGDLVIYVTWRGLASNKALLGFGKMGGEVKAIQSPATASELVSGRRAGDRQRFMEQAGFGPTPSLAEIPAGTPLRRWIAAQFATSYPTFPYPDSNLTYPLRPSTPPTDCDGNATVVDITPTCFLDTYTMYPLQSWNSKEMLYGGNQLKHKVSWALSQIWVTSGVDIQQSRHMVEYHKILSANAFGNFRDLMGPTTANPSNSGMTLNPTMGDYLSMSQSTRTNPNENYAREIKQLFTIGLFMLNQDGTVICVEHNPCQPGDTKTPSYDQNVVNNLTKVFTGWKFCPGGNAACPNAVAGTFNFVDPLIVTNSNEVDTSAKTLLTASTAPSNIDACTNCTGGTTAVNLANTQAYARTSMIRALDNIFNHPNVGPFIGKILIQQMVTSDPTPAYVSRVAAAFNNNGVGVRGDMKAVISAILLDPEARGNVKTDPNYGKLREPVQFAANFLRAHNVKDAAGTGQSDGVLTFRSEYTGMGQTPFRSPTVFNYYSPDFVIPGTSVLGPEFGIMTTGTTIQRMNFINRMVGWAANGTALAGAPIPINTSAAAWTPSGTSLDFSDLQALVAADTSGATLLDELNSRLMHGTMPAAMRASILGAVTPISSTDTINRVRQAVYLTATSAQYQVQR